MELQLKQTIPQELRDAYVLPPEEDILYAVLHRLDQAGKVDETAVFIATDETITIVEDGVQTKWGLDEFASYGAEQGVYSGYLWAEHIDDGEPVLLLRFAARDKERFNYIARALTMLHNGEVKEIKVKEREKRCDVCGSAYRGASFCMNCDGGTWNNLRGVVKMLKPYRKSMIRIAIPVLLIAAISVGQRFLERHLIDAYLIPGEGSWVTALIIFLVAAGILGVMLASFMYRDYVSNRLGTQLAANLRQEVYEQVNRIPQAQFELYQGGELMHRIMHDTAMIRRFIEMFLPMVLSQGVTLIATFVTMILISPRYSLIAVLLIPPAAILVRWLHSRDIRLWRARWRFEDRLSSRIQDVISGIRIVKSYGQEDRESERFRNEAFHLGRLTTKSELFWATIYPWVTLLMMGGTILVTGFGTIDVLDGKMTAGTLNQLLAYTGMLFGPIGFLTRLPRMLMRLNTSLNRIQDIMDEPLHEQEKWLDLPEDVAGEFEFDDMSFGYASYEPVLENISTKIRPGEKIGLVGRSGAGKSTFVNLVMRLYQPDEGVILLDGQPLNEINPESYHKHLGVVLQESFLFSGTVAQNIAYADPGASRERIIEAAKMANAHDFIVSFPDGYDSRVGERGQRLSGGERQRIAIARAILHKPSILILDEPTSSLDIETEFQIQEAMERLTKGRTTFMIAHRLATLKNSDRIMLIDGHKIAEFGTHDELMRRQGLYYDLVLAQLEMHKVEPETLILEETEMAKA